MACGDQIDVMRPLLCQAPENCGKLFRSYRLSGVEFRADLIILAEDAPQGTAGEKDRAGTACSADAGFLPKMQCRAGYDRFRPHAAVTGAGACFPFCPTAAGAEHAALSFHAGLPLSAP